MTSSRILHIQIILAAQQLLLTTTTTKTTTHATTQYSSNMEAIVSTIEAMRLQEQRSYICHDYLYQHEHEEAQLHGPLSKQKVTNECREKMVQWCYKVCYFLIYIVAFVWDQPRRMLF
jgi:hypothetical protein